MQVLDWLYNHDFHQLQHIALPKEARIEIFMPIPKDSQYNLQMMLISTHF